MWNYYVYAFFMWMQWIAPNLTRFLLLSFLHSFWFNLSSEKECARLILMLWELKQTKKKHCHDEIHLGQKMKRGQGIIRFMRKHIKRPVSPINKLPVEFCLLRYCARVYIYYAVIFLTQWSSHWETLFLWSTIIAWQSLYFIGVQMLILFYLLTCIGNSGV